MTKHNEHSTRDRRPRLGAVVVLAAGIGAALSCGDRTEVISPVVRVDLRPALPPWVQRRLAAQDDSFACEERIRLADGGASQRLVATYRVLEQRKDRYITAVEVEPAGPTAGATAPAATAIVGEPRLIAMAAGGQAAVVAVKVSWQARQGCSRVEAARTVELRANAPSCKRPTSHLRLLTP